MPKLLIVSTVSMTLRGFLLPYAQHFRSRGWQVDAMVRDVSKCPASKEAFDRVFEIDWSRNPFQISQLLKTPGFIRDHVRREGYDLVHVHTPIAAFLTRLALRKMRTQGKPRVIYTAHGFHFHPQGTWLKNKIYQTLEGWGGNWTDYLVVINREDEAAAKRLHLVPDDRVRFMPGIGVDTAYYSPESVSPQEVARARQELGLAHDQPFFFMIAEFIARKRHRDALHALAQLRRPEVVLGFAGTGPVEAEMKALAGTLGIDKQVRFLGYRRDIPTLVRASRAVLLPSHHEGLPRSIMEALSLEVPCIGTRIRGITDLLEHDTGLLFPVGDVGAFSKQLGWMLDHPQEARAMGKKGRELMADFDLQRLIRLHEDLYDEALNLKPAEVRS